jgi:hypothetical protein
MTQKQQLAIPKPKPKMPELTPEQALAVDKLIAECLKEASAMPREQEVTFKNLYPNQKHEAIHN